MKSAKMIKMEIIENGLRFFVEKYMPDIKSPFPRANYGLRKKIAVKILLKSVVYAFAIFGLLFILLLFAVLGLIRTSAPVSGGDGNAILTVDLDLPFPEVRQDTLLTELVPSGELSFQELLMTLAQAANDDNVKALAARINVPALGLAQMQELHQIIERFRAGGKPAYVYSPGFGSLDGGTAAYYLATAFSEITMQPNSEIGLTGISAEIPFVRALLDRVGVTPEFYGRYEYKNAMASFMDKDISPAFRENMRQMVSRLNESLAEGMLKSRFAKPSETDFTDIINKAPFSAEYAKTIGLIDKIAFESEWQNRLKKEHDAELVDLPSYAAGIRLNKRGGKLALLVLEGTITDTYGLNPLKDGEINSRAVLDVISEIRADNKIKGVLVRVNSPGGSYTASAEIWNALQQLKNDKKIPLLVSMGDYAASGGYFISLAGDKIFADETTLTGSIGVVGGKFALADLWKKLDVKWTLLSQSENAGILSANSKFNKSQKLALNKSLDRIYKDFTLRVSEARNLSAEQLDKLARGRVWIGADARKKGLVDEIGGLDEALAELKQRAGIGAKDKFALVIYPKPRTLQEKIRDLVSSSPVISLKSTAQKLGLDVRELNVLKQLQYDAVMPPVIIGK